MRVLKLKKKSKRTYSKTSGLRRKIYERDGNFYEGEWMDNAKHGYGTQLWTKSNLMYTGDWKSGKRNGRGTLYLASNTRIFVYNGEWKDDKRNGEGIAVFRDGSNYDGGWMKDRREGFGRMNFSDGSSYAGQWHKNRRKGKGLIVLSDGSFYSGDWRKDKRQGRGTMVKGSTVYEGQWHDDRKHGEGIFVDFSTCTKIKGVWLDNVLRCGTLVSTEDEELDGISLIDAEIPLQWLAGFTLADPKRTEASLRLPLPECTLRDPEAVLEHAREYYLSKAQMR